jgi:O-succinylbenzoic acid--CoA ligase
VEESWDGLGPGDLVVVEEPLGPAWPGIVRAAWGSGAALLPVDPRLTPGESTRILERAAATHRRGSEGELLPLTGGEPVAADTALVVATSGTSGEPKLVELSRDAVAAAVAASAERIGTGPWLACMPPAHIGGLLVFLRAVLGGQPVVVHDRFDPGRVAAEPGVTYLSFVPTMLYRLVEHGVDLARFEAIVVGGAGLPAPLAERAAASGARLVRTYGQTESVGGTVYDGVPLAGTGMQVVDGEVWLSGPTLMRGYRRDPAATTAVLPGDGWLRTGDGGWIGDDGLLRVSGRLEDAVATGGETVWPAEVEAVLREHPAVADVAIAGAPDPEWGQRAVAFVVPADPAAPPSLEDLRAFGAGSLAGYKLPREVRYLSELPRNLVGKVVRPRLLH